jgi:hypothetical protein
MRLSAGKLILAFVCLLLSTLVCFVYFVATAVIAGMANIGQVLIASIGQAVSYFFSRWCFCGC